MRTWTVGLMLGASAMALAGCSSDGGGDGAEPRPTYAELDGELDALFEAADDSTAIAFADLPQSGSASYEGAMSLEGGDGVFEGSDRIVGEVEAELDFGDDELAGSADNFVTAGGVNLDGSLAIEEGVLYPDGITQAAEVAGVFRGTLDGTGERRYEIDLDFEGVVLGPDADYIGAFLEGQGALIYYETADGPGVAQDLGGLVVVER